MILTTIDGHGIEGICSF